MIAITLNGEARKLPAGKTFADLIAGLDAPPPSLATAVNGEFVAREARNGRKLRDGDAVFTFQPITGGWHVFQMPASAQSRFFLGTAGYPSPQVLQQAIAASGAQVVTVGLKRQLAAAGVPNDFYSLIRNRRATLAQHRRLPHGARSRRAGQDGP